MAGVAVQQLNQPVEVLTNEEPEEKRKAISTLSICLRRITDLSDSIQASRKYRITLEGQPNHEKNLRKEIMKKLENNQALPLSPVGKLSG